MRITVSVVFCDNLSGSKKVRKTIAIAVMIKGSAYFCASMNDGKYFSLNISNDVVSITRTVIEQITTYTPVMIFEFIVILFAFFL